jgi:hypothetical protein
MSGGIALFDGISATAAGTFVLSFESDGISQPTNNIYFSATSEFLRARGVSPVFVVVPDVVASLRVVTQPSDLLLQDSKPNGFIPMYAGPIVQAMDQYGNGVGRVAIIVRALNEDASDYAPGLLGNRNVTTVVWESGGVSTFTNLEVGAGTAGSAIILRFSTRLASGSEAFVDSSSIYFSGATALRATGLWPNSDTQAPVVAAASVSDHSYEIRILENASAADPILGSSSPVTVQLLDSQGRLTQMFDAGAQRRIDMLSALPVNGIATFTGITMALSGRGFYLQFNYIGITVNSSRFDVSPGSPESLRIVQQPKHIVTETPFTADATPLLEVYDGLGNLAVGVQAFVSVFAERSQSQGPPLRVLLNNTACSTTFGCVLQTRNGTVALRSTSIRGVALDAQLRFQLTTASTTLPGATPNVQSNTFIVASRPPASMSPFQNPDTSVPANESVSVSFQVFDRSGNLVDIVERGIALAGDATSVQLSLMSRIENNAYAGMWIAVGAPAADVPWDAGKRILSYNGTSRIARTSGAIDAKEGDMYTIYYMANVTLLDLLRGGTFSPGAVVKSDSLRDLVMYTGVDKTPIRAGVAAFEGFRVNRIGDYRFLGTVEGFPSASIRSNAFRVQPGDASVLMFVDVAPGSPSAFANLTADDVITPFSLRVRDANGNNVISSTVQVELAIPQVPWCHHAYFLCFV